MTLSKGYLQCLHGHREERLNHHSSQWRISLLKFLNFIRLDSFIIFKHLSHFLISMLLLRLLLLLLRNWSFPLRLLLPFLQCLPFQLHRFYCVFISFSFLIFTFNGAPRRSFGSQNKTNIGFAHGRFAVPSQFQLGEFLQTLAARCDTVSPGALLRLSFSLHSIVTDSSQLLHSSFTVASQ